ncbi:MAG: PLP-dependent aminotransferase family protein [Ruminococcaceae bacterium]|nr:PLP-dependent aminotransferase family protein [Oscillospiraceae bacterium]
MKKDKFLYLEIYDRYKQMIVSGKLKNGERLPSIRSSAELNNVSKTTVEQAYMLLCDDGYVIPKNQSGFYVSGRAETIAAAEKSRLEKERDNSVVSDYTSTGVDSEIFDLNLWSRYIKNALRKSYMLTEYGEPQGEEGLREKIAEYVKSNRNCICDRDDIVIGAGVQTLLNILCALIKDKKTVCFNERSYRQGVAVFSDHGFKITDSPEKADVLYYSPSYYTDSRMTNVGYRHQLVKRAHENGQLIIEDDYDSEFRDLTTPTPTLQGLDSANVVYIGTFSKLLLPSIRISYMILPEKLLSKYRRIYKNYNQTVSIPDQLALEEFIADRKLHSQLKRAKKIYSQKSKLLCDCLKKEFGAGVSIDRLPTPLYVGCRIKTRADFQKVSEILGSAQRKIRLMNTPSEDGCLSLLFSVSSVKTEYIPEDIHRLSLALKNV